MPQESARSRIEPFHVMDVWAAAAQRGRTHGDVLTLAAGQPATAAPAGVLAAARAALTGDTLGYTVTPGIPALREAIAGHHRRDGLEVTAEDVVVTTGSSGAFTLLFLAALDPGDVVALARPGYPAYRNTLAALGCRVLELDCRAESRFQPTVAMLDALETPPAALVVASPANPTGTILAPAELAALATWCEDRGTLLVSDEIYHGISYGRPTTSAWATSRSSVVVGSVSKYFSMTGWRLGWMLAPEPLRPAVHRLASNLTICPPALAQHAAVAAFTDASYTELDGHVHRYRRNRDLLLDGLPALGLTDLAPADGAFYVYADVAHRTDDARAWCADLLAETGVAIAPGLDFDTVHGHHTVRFSFAGATADVEQALERLAGSRVVRG